MVGVLAAFRSLFSEFLGKKLRGQERPDSLKSVVFAFVLDGCPGFGVLRFRQFPHKNPHVDGHIVPGWTFLLCVWGFLLCENTFEATGTCGFSCVHLRVWRVRVCVCVCACPFSWFLQWVSGIF